VYETVEVFCACSVYHHKEEQKQKRMSTFLLVGLLVAKNDPADTQG
jgi:hypothetical protein